MDEELLILMAEGAGRAERRWRGERRPGRRRDEEPAGGGQRRGRPTSRTGEHTGSESSARGKNH